MHQWEELLATGRANPAIADLVFFVTTQAALELSGPRGVRLGLSILMRTAGELDPSQRPHQMIVGCALSAFLLYMAMSISVLKDVFEFGMTRRDFEQRLRYFLLEGRENYACG